VAKLVASLAVNSGLWVRIQHRGHTLDRQKKLKIIEMFWELFSVSNAYSGWYSKGIVGEDFRLKPEMLDHF